MKEGARNVKDSAKGAWDTAGDVVFKDWTKGKGGWKGEDDYAGGDDWGSYGYGDYGRWPDEDSYRGIEYDGKKWEGDYGY